MKNQSAIAMAEAYARGEQTPLEVVQDALSLIKTLNPALNAISFRNDDSVIASAEQITKRYQSRKSEKMPPFAGVPIAIKALTPVQGWPYDACSRADKGKVASQNHDVVSALQRAGFILLCQTTSPELGAVPVTESALYGATRNPWNLERTPGGSSGGAAAVVAAGIVPVAEASDGGGSIRIPASCCGLVGMKPSRGRVWSGPDYARNELSTKGILSHSVEDSAALLDIFTSIDHNQWDRLEQPVRTFRDEVKEDPGQLKIGITSTAPIGSGVSAGCVEAVEQVAGQLAALNHEVFEVTPPWDPVELFVEHFLTVWASCIGELQVNDEALLEPHVQYLREKSFSENAADLARAWSALQRISRRITSEFESRYDVLVTPTCSIEPPEIGTILRENDPDPSQVVYRSFDMVPFTPWFNVTGQPAISLPLAVSDGRLPIGVQFVGPPRGEAVLFRLAAQLERAGAFRRPAALDPALGLRD